MKILRVAVYILLAAALAAGQARDAERGRKILEQAIKALGGKAYLNARDYHAEGRAFQFSSREELAGMAPVATFERFPGKYRQEIGKHKEEVFIINGTDGWDVTFRGVRMLPEDEIQRVLLNREMSVDNILRFRLNEPGLVAEWVNTDMADGRRVEIVEITDSKNRVVTISFDESTHFPLQREWERPIPKTREREQNVESLSKYLTVKGAPGVMAPYYIRRERNGMKVFETFLNEVKLNSNVSESLFSKPSGPERK